MQTELLKSENDFEWFKNYVRVPLYGERPKTYPCIVAYICPDGYFNKNSYIDLVFIYPEDFSK